jgi:tetratricopeptide (TPR) repeat protein
MIVQFEPNHANALNIITEFYFDSGSYEEAIPYFERLSQNKNYASSSTFDGRLAYSDFLYRYATSLNLLQRKQEALEVLDSLLEVLPYHLQGLRLIGPLLIEKEDWNQASQVYKSLLMNVGSGGSESLEIYTILGEIDIARKLYDSAIQYFVRAFRIDPEDNRVLHSLAQICVIKKNWNKALQLYQKIISSGTSTKEVTMEGMLIKAWILDKQLGHTDISFKHLEQSLQFESNQPIVLLSMAEIRFNQAAYSEALDLLERMVALEESPHHNLALMLKSACLEKSGELGEAKAIQAYLNVDSSILLQQIKEGFEQPLY